MTFLSGQHYILDITMDIDKMLLMEADTSTYLNIMKEACDVAKVKILNTAFHNFEPMGFTALLLLSESHMSIHTYPENWYIAIDLYTCGSRQLADAAIAHVKSAFENFGAISIKTNITERGI